MSEEEKTMDGVEHAVSDNVEMCGLGILKQVFSLKSHKVASGAKMHL